MYARTLVVYFTDAETGNETLPLKRGNRNGNDTNSLQKNANSISFFQGESDDTHHVQVLDVQDDRTFTKKHYVYNIDGVQRDVTAVCDTYL
jgi:hypothetical protein